MKRERLLHIVNSMHPGIKSAEMIQLVDTAMDGEHGVDWIRYSRKFKEFLNTGNPQFSVFSESGNRKLPFLAFSALPLVTCPGALECRKYCYSLKAFRYPAAFFKLAQNTLLIWQNQNAITETLNNVLSSPKFKKQKTIDFRIYVDGDFSSVSDLEYWFSVLRENPKLQAYGYSKSFNVFREFDIKHDNRITEIPDPVWPDNYQLNISTGSRFDANPGIQNHMRMLPVTRGIFTTVKLDKHYTMKDGHSKEYKDAIRKAYGKPCFPCPLDCSNCTKKGHACGSKAFHGVDIVCPMH